MLVRPSLATFTFVSSLLAAFAACSDDDVTPSTPTDDGGVDAQSDSAPVVPTDKESKQSGRIIRAQTTDEVIPGATVSVGSNTAVADGAGKYEIAVPRNEPYSYTVTANGFFKLLEQELILKTEAVVRADTQLLSTETATFLTGFLPGRKPELGLLVVKVNPVAPCTSEEGSTVTIDPAGEAQLSYFGGGGLPEKSRTSIKQGTSFSAAFYNIAVGVPVKVIVSSPLCAQAAFPIDVGDVTYTGFQKTEAGEALSYLRVYIKDPIASDAGPDAN